MKAYLNAPIKEVITKFPEVAGILTSYDIGCVPCAVGTCLLKDVVTIHNISENKKAELMYRVEKAIYPDRQIAKPVPVAEQPGSKKEVLRYSPPLKALVDEHDLIKRLLKSVPGIAKYLRKNPALDKELVLNIVDFIRKYADKLHHAKEEDILFKYFDGNSDVLKTMLADHTSGREHVKSVVKALNENDRESIILHLEGYAALLTEHIRKEDEILYPWMDRGLSVSQVGELFTKFNEVDTVTQKGVAEKYRKSIELMEEQIITE